MLLRDFSRAALAAGAVITLLLAPAAGAAEIEPRIDRILHAMGDYLASAKEFSFRADVRFDRVYSDGQKIEYGRRVRVAVRRPDRLHATIKGDLENQIVWYDGKRFTILDEMAGTYASTEVPGTIDAALDLLAERYDITSPVADVTYSDPYRIMTEHIEEARYVGRHQIDGIATHQLAFRQPAIDWQVWIEDGYQAVPRKLVITYKNAERSPQFRTRLFEWNFATRLPDALFVFDPPPDLVETAFPGVSN